MCDDACCDFLAEIPNQISHIDWRIESHRAMCEDACFDFYGQEIQNQISHIDWRTASGDVR
jgi:hypothetical protein